MIHLITPFSRPENLQFYLDNLKDKNVIWHPIFQGGVPEELEAFDWVRASNVFEVPEGIFPNIYKCNTFITPFNKGV